MDTRPDETALALTQFGIGQPVPRSEDPTLVRGLGRYTDDLQLPRQVYAAIVRSPHAHGIIRSIDTEAARAMPGVLAIYTAEDLKDYGPLKCGLPLKGRDGSPIRQVPRPALAADRVRWVGDPVACVIAETAWQAKDAAETVSLDIEPLPAVTAASEADHASAAQLYDDVPGNLILDYHYGDAAKTAEAFAKAAHVETLSIRNTRLIVSAMEPRAAIAEYDGGTWTLHCESQGVFGMRGQIMSVLGVGADKVRVLTGQVGGSFGMKASIYPEYICLLHAARALGRPVKWTDERSGSFVSDSHGRDHEMKGELALDADGNFLALRMTGYGNMGGYLANVGPMPATINTVKNVASVYRTPLIEVSSRLLYTNTTPVSAYRGAGRPEGNYYMERLIDNAARAMGIDRIELRRRNMIRPRDLPYHNASDMNYDSGDFPAVLKHAVDFADLKGFAKRKRESRKAGLLRGLGVGCYLEVTAPANKEMGGIRFETDGTVTIITGTLDYGQGHATPFAQVLTERLGVPFERIRLLQGDSNEMLAGGGTGGSRSITASGQAIVEAADLVIEKGRAIAAHVLEASTEDVEFRNGRFVVAGTDHGIGIVELATRLRSGLTLPEGVPSELDVSHVSNGPPSAFPNGCHVAEVEIDPQTGRVAVVRYSAVNDFGTVVNPLLVEGQTHGGVMQGIGQALMENVSYDSEGQLLTGSYMDYALPRAKHAPAYAVVSHPVPAKTNPLGTKGCGEAGCAGGLTSVMNAVVDALADQGITHIDMPASPARVWAALQQSAA
ncbi:MAG: xanthine dehydrogenase family protein molybdopterin-binding subunit [Rhizobiales bacterium]|nr:xanthine dehydrogenase family protein molybdopterin-binding subunit [Hyphomicrobiales bacterium]OJY46041.1 MAG: carbon monoxide dehydrogenase [Rhizobiales bacterium 64-17]